MTPGPFPDFWVGPGDETSQGCARAARPDHVSAGEIYTETSCTLMLPWKWRRKLCLWSQSREMDDLNQDYRVERGVGGKRPFSDDDHNGGPAVKRINVNIGRCPPMYFCQKKSGLPFLF